MFDRIFLDHPRSVDESYLEHMAFAARFSVTLLIASAAALVHALVPCCCERTASQVVATLYRRTHNRGVPAALHDGAGI